LSFGRNTAMAKVTYEYMNPNYKESLDREWWCTSTQLMPKDDYIEAIKNKDPSITVVDASCRQLQGSRIEMISEAMIGNPHITAIDLRGNGFDADGLYALVQALKTMPNVKSLNLRSNTCRNQGAEALGEFLKTNTTLIDINLNENNLGSPGAIHIANGMKENKTVKILDLSLNYIDDEGGKVIAEMLDVNTTLEQLSVSGNEMKDYDLRQKCRARVPKNKKKLAGFHAAGPRMEDKDYDETWDKINPSRPLPPAPSS